MLLLVVITSRSTKKRFVSFCVFQPKKDWKICRQVFLVFLFILNDDLFAAVYKSTCNPVWRTNFFFYSKNWKWEMWTDFSFPKQIDFGYFCNWSINFNLSWFDCINNRETHWTVKKCDAAKGEETFYNKWRNNRLC